MNNSNVLDQLNRGLRAQDLSGTRVPFVARAGLPSTAPKPNCWVYIQTDAASSALALWLWQASSGAYRFSVSVP